MNQRNRRKPSAIRRKAAAPERSWQTYLVMAICLLMLVAGFFFAARQHFSSMDYGMRNSKLRKQIEELEAEKRRLLHAREVSMSPAEIKKAAVRTQVTAPAELGIVSDVKLASASPREQKIRTGVASAGKTLVVKTSAVNATTAKIAAVYRKPEPAEKSIKKAKLPR